ncbi:MAG: Helix-turn-helix domain protein [Caulobacteraceae bacterium]|nr:Helix-turn-helix domain protein [Caulobacteraceae bacterium]
MAYHRVNPRLAKLHQPYTVEQVAALFRKHPHTVREWIKAGLPIVDKRRPIMIRGRDLRTFLEGRKASKRQPCPPGTIYCFSCREPRRPALEMADFEARDQGAGNLKALCEACGGPMYRRANPARLSEILPGIEVRIVRALPGIADPNAPSQNLDLRQEPTSG